MLERFLSVQDTLFLIGLAGILIKIFQLWKEGKFHWGFK